MAITKQAIQARANRAVALIEDVNCHECGGFAIVLMGRTRMVHEWWCKFARQLVDASQKAA